MNHPCRDLEATPLRRTLEGAVAELERNGDLSLTAARTHVIGHPCRAITESAAGDPPRGTNPLASEDGQRPF